MICPVRRGSANLWIFHVYVGAQLHEELDHPTVTVKGRIV